MRTGRSIILNFCIAQSNKGANELRGFAYFEIFFYKSVSKGVSVFYFISENCSGIPIK